MAFLISKRSWRRYEKLTGKIFREKRVKITMRQNKYPEYKMVYNDVCAQITLDDANPVDWLVQDAPTVEPEATTKKPVNRQTLNMKTYRREDCKVGCGRGMNKTNNGHVFGIDAESEALGWKGREYYTDYEFLAWTKSATKLKDLSRVDLNMYTKIKRAQRDVMPMPN